MGDGWGALWRWMGNECLLLNYEMVGDGWWSEDLYVMYDDRWQHIEDIGIGCVFGNFCMYFVVGFDEG